MKIKELAARCEGMAFLDELMGLWRVVPQDVNNVKVPVIRAGAMLMVETGSLTYKVGTQTGVIAANDFADFSVCKTPVHLVEASPDLKGLLFCFTQKYVMSVFGNHPPFSSSYVNYVCRNPVCRLPQETAEVVTKALQSILSSLRDGDNIHQRKILEAKTRILYMEIANIFEGKGLIPETAMLFSDRSMALFSQLVEALREHAMREHGVEFYAEKVHVSPQYLNRVVRSIANRTASAVVTEAVLGEAKRMLENTELPLGQIAEAMNFSDYAAFSKFFKRLTGLTPNQYRNLP
ncbi:MAG: helix-turn-helix domain-containing protein [Alloprevotella sp.]